LFHARNAHHSLKSPACLCVSITLPVAELKHGIEALAPNPNERAAQIQKVSAHLKRANLRRSWSKISKAGWSRAAFQPWIATGERFADAPRCDRKRFVGRAEEELTAFLELEATIRTCGKLP
jgi:hypothetical protein